MKHLELARILLCSYMWCNGGGNRSRSVFLPSEPVLCSWQNPRSNKLHGRTVEVKQVPVVSEFYCEICAQPVISQRQWSCLTWASTAPSRPASSWTTSPASATPVSCSSARTTCRTMTTNATASTRRMLRWGKARAHHLVNKQVLELNWIAELELSILINGNVVIFIQVVFHQRAKEIRYHCNVNNSTFIQFFFQT